MVRAATPQVDKIIERIPKMRMRETVELWRNAIRALEDKRRKELHPAAQRVLGALDQEWKRRYTHPHPQDRFEWPSTHANPGSGAFSTEGWIDEGVLQYLGYKVGVGGEPKGYRARILAQIFVGQLPPVFPPPYLNEWGPPSSVARLRKMAETIAALTRNAKRRRDSRMHRAIQDWENDLEFLYYEYYVGKFRFDWPSTSIDAI